MDQGVEARDKGSYYAHETSSNVKTSFKNNHVVDLASHEHDVRSVHIIKICKRKILFTSPRIFDYVINRFEIQ